MAARWTVRATLILALTSVMLVIAAGAGTTDQAVATDDGIACQPSPECLASVPKPPPYNCDASRDGQVVWSDGWTWECRNVGGFYRWVPLGPGYRATFRCVQNPVPCFGNGRGGTYTWTVYAPQNPYQSSSATVTWGDGSSSTQTVPQGSGSSTLYFTHYYPSTTQVYILGASIDGSGSTSYSIFVEP